MTMARARSTGRSTRRGANSNAASAAAAAATAAGIVKTASVVGGRVATRGQQQKGHAAAKVSATTTIATVHATTAASKTTRMAEGTSTEEAAEATTASGRETLSSLNADLAEARLQAGELKPEPIALLEQVDVKKLRGTSDSSEPGRNTRSRSGRLEIGTTQANRQRSAKTLTDRGRKGIRRQRNSKGGAGGRSRSDSEDKGEDEGGGGDGHREVTTEIGSVPSDVIMRRNPAPLLSDNLERPTRHDHSSFPRSATSKQTEQIAPPNRQPWSPHVNDVDWYEEEGSQRPALESHTGAMSIIPPLADIGNCVTEGVRLRGNDGRFSSHSRRLGGHENLSQKNRAGKKEGDQNSQKDANVQDRVVNDDHGGQTAKDHDGDVGTLATRVFEPDLDRRRFHARGGLGRKPQRQSQPEMKKISEESGSAHSTTTTTMTNRLASESSTMKTVSSPRCSGDGGGGGGGVSGTAAHDSIVLGLGLTDDDDNDVVVVDEARMADWLQLGHERGGGGGRRTGGGLPTTSTPLRVPLRTGRWLSPAAILGLGAGALLANVSGVGVVVDGSEEPKQQQRLFDEAEEVGGQPEAANDRRENDGGDGRGRGGGRGGGGSRAMWALRAPAEGQGRAAKKNLMSVCEEYDEEEQPPAEQMGNVDEDEEDEEIECTVEDEEGQKEKEYIDVDEEVEKEKECIDVDEEDEKEKECIDVDEEEKACIDEEKACIDKEKECIDEDKECKDKEKECIDTEKECIDKENECIDKEKECIDKEKECIDKEKECIDKEKECIDKEKECIDKEKECIDKEKECIDKEKEYVDEEKQCIDEEKGAQIEQLDKAATVVVAATDDDRVKMEASNLPPLAESQADPTQEGRRGRPLRRGNTLKRLNAATSQRQRGRRKDANNVASGALARNVSSKDPPPKVLILRQGPGRSRAGNRFFKHHIPVSSVKVSIQGGKMKVVPHNSPATVKGPIDFDYKDDEIAHVAEEGGMCDNFGLASLDDRRDIPLNTATYGLRKRKAPVLEKARVKRKRPSKWRFNDSGSPVKGIPSGLTLEQYEDAQIREKFGFPNVWVQLTRLPEPKPKRKRQAKVLKDLPDNADGVKAVTTVAIGTISSAAVTTTETTTTATTTPTVTTIATTTTTTSTSASNKAGTTTTTTRTAATQSPTVGTATTIVRNITPPARVGPPPYVVLVRVEQDSTQKLSPEPLAACMLDASCSRPVPDSTDRISSPSICSPPSSREPSPFPDLSSTTKLSSVTTAAISTTTPAQRHITSTPFQTVVRRKQYDPTQDAFGFDKIDTPPKYRVRRMADSLFIVNSPEKRPKELTPKAVRNGQPSIKEVLVRRAVSLEQTSTKSTEKRGNSNDNNNSTVLPSPLHHHIQPHMASTPLNPSEMAPGTHRRRSSFYGNAGAPAAAAATTASGSSAVSNTTETSHLGGFGRMKRLIDRMGRRQLQIDAGQERFGAATCASCGMVYSQGEAEDERQHTTFHRRMLLVVQFKGWKDGRVLDIVVELGKAYLFHPQDSKVVREKLNQVIMHANTTIGFDPEYIKIDPSVHLERLHAFFVTNSGKIASIVATEPWTKAVQTLPGDEVLVDDACHRTVSASVIFAWTLPKYRRRGLASRLLFHLRAILAGAGNEPLGFDEIAFSDPTPDLHKFAKALTESDRYLVAV